MTRVDTKKKDTLYVYDHHITSELKWYSDTAHTRKMRIACSTIN